MIMKHKTFEEFLQREHAKDYHGTDDDMPDSFEYWITDELQFDELFAFADEFAKQQREELIDEIKKYRTLSTEEVISIITNSDK